MSCYPMTQHALHICSSNCTHPVIVCFLQRAFFAFPDNFLSSSVPLHKLTHSAPRASFSQVHTHFGAIRCGDAGVVLMVDEYCCGLLLLLCAMLLVTSSRQKNNSDNHKEQIWSGASSQDVDHLSPSIPRSQSLHS